MTDKPLVSIITVVYNAKDYIEQTIKSVINQTYRDIEYIIIDGGSTDGTLEIIQKYEDSISYWISEEDNGIYDAMNKGVTASAGGYVAFLNADDWYNDDTIESIANVIKEDGSDFVFANVDMYDENDQYSHTFSAKAGSYRRMMPFGHPTLFVKRDILLLLPFDLQYPTASDYDLICKLMSEKYSFSYLDKSIVHFRFGGVSTTTNTQKELFSIHKKHFGLSNAIYYYLRTTKQPIISNIIEILVSLKYSIEQRKLIWYQHY